MEIKFGLAEALFVIRDNLRRKKEEAQGVLEPESRKMFLSLVEEAEINASGLETFFRTPAELRFK